MRNHIVFKFLAIVLCAAALLSAVAGGVGIFAMTELGLYERTVDELYEEQLKNYALNYGINRWERYAARNLGGANEALAASFYPDQWNYNIFRPDRVGYRILDGDGNAVLEEPMTESTGSKYFYEFPADYPYMKVLSEVPYVEEIPEIPVEPVTTQIGDTYVYDAIPENGAEVYGYEIGFADGSSEGVFSEEPVGFLRKNEDGMVEMLPTEDNGSIEMSAYPVQIVFVGRDEICLYQATNPAGVMESAEYRRGMGQSILLRKLTEEAFVMDAIPPEGCEVATVTVTYEDGSSESVGGVPHIGSLSYNEHGGIRFTVHDKQMLLNPDLKIVHIVFYDEGGNPVYEARNPEGVGHLYVINDIQIFLTEPEQEASRIVTEVTIPVVTMPVYKEESDSDGVPTEPVVVPQEKTGEIYYYYNNTAQHRMEVEYTMESATGYTVQVQLAAKPLADESAWVLVRTLYGMRNYLPVALIAGLLLFAFTAVYLCRVAGRKPKSDEICAGGLNCIPLDLYLAMAGFGMVCLVFVAVEVIPEIIGDITVTVLVGGLLAYAASLLIVGFCFACAAQFKTPGGYWWRHSFCGYCLKLIGKLCRLLMQFVRWLWVFCKTALWPEILKIVKAFFNLIGKTLKKIGQFLKKAGKTVGLKANRFYSLLPVTWQWMLCGSALVLVIFLAAESRRAKWMLLSILIGFGLILYGAHCFGLLLESAKRMSKGNLEEKVDDKLMTGAFKEFAGELNSLADVAVVAAQKQLKSERMKTELITNVSHDIKTPLTSIINYVDLLQKPHSDEEQEKYLEVLDRQSQRLKKLIDDLMEMSKASTGNLAVEITRVDAAEAVNQALGEFSDKLDKAGLFPVFRQPDKAVYMMADGRLVWRVMSNLLSNAVKYALPGTRLYVDLQQLENKVILSMKNISREELNVQADELLERFVRGDTSRNTEGSGLGLNIAQSLMELQKGQLQILVDGDLFKVTLIFPAAE